jgi:hypothetical protein
MYKKAADTHYCAKIFKEGDKWFFLRRDSQ